jgi:hypothetical protein
VRVVTQGQTREDWGWRARPVGDRTEKEGEEMAFRWNSRDGQEHEVGIDEVTKLAWTDDSGEEHEVDLDKVTRLAWIDDSGEEQEVEGHGYRWPRR